MIKLNNISQGNIDGTVLFSNIPNIVEYSASDYGGTRASLKIELNSNYSTVEDGETITINGETIIATKDITRCSGRYFYTGNIREWFAPTMVNALRNCRGITSNYDVYISNDDGGELIDGVSIIAKENGSRYNIKLEKTSGFDAFDKYGAGMKIKFTLTNGNSTDELMNCNYAKVMLQLYKIDDVKLGNVLDPIESSEYVTTLQKTYHKDGVRFDISPVLSSVVNYGKLTYIRFVVSVYSTSPSNPFQFIAEQRDIYATYGYRSNSSMPYIPRDSVPTVLGNINDMTLYIYEPKIRISYLSSSNTMQFNIKYLDSAYRNIYGESKYLSNTLDFSIDLDKDKFRQSSYVSVESAYGDVMFKVIKGIDAADKCRRIYWRNEMGGISFFDFTGAFNKEFEIDRETYIKGNLNYYNSSEYEVSYSNDVSLRHTVSTHLIDKSSTNIFESLSRSHCVWTEDDGEVRYIIIDDVSVSQDSNYDDVYSASVQFHYSREK